MPETPTARISQNPNEPTESREDAANQSNKSDPDKNDFFRWRHSVFHPTLLVTFRHGTQLRRRQLRRISAASCQSRYRIQKIAATRNTASTKSTKRTTVITRDLLIQILLSNRKQRSPHYICRKSCLRIKLSKFAPTTTLP